MGRALWVAWPFSPLYPSGRRGFWPALPFSGSEGGQSSRAVSQVRRPPDMWTGSRRWTYSQCCSLAFKAESLSQRGLGFSLGDLSMLAALLVGQRWFWPVVFRSPSAAILIWVPVVETEETCLALRSEDLTARVEFAICIEYLGLIDE